MYSEVAPKLKICQRCAVKGKVARSARKVVDMASKVVLGTPFTSFTGTKVQILTQKALASTARTVVGMAGSGSLYSLPVSVLLYL